MTYSIDTERRRKTKEITMRNAKHIVEIVCDHLAPTITVTPYDDLPEIVRLAGEELKKCPPAEIRDRLCTLIEGCIKILRYI